MLRALDIRDILIIDRLELRFRPGLNVLTGETGAGKSILLDCLGFVLGWRGRADLVREGAPEGEVTAEFDLPGAHPAQEVLREAGLSADEGTLLIRRVNRAGGTKTAWVNDRRVSGEILRRLSDSLVELHGQQDDRGLLDPRVHRAMLDAHGGLEPRLAEVRAAWAAQRDARKRLAEAERVLDETRAEEDFLRHAVEELDRLAPEPGEEAELDSRRRMMQGAERVREDVARALAALGPDGAEGNVADALRWIEGAAEATDGRLEAPLAALGRAMTELGEAAAGVEDCLRELDVDPLELERTEERLFAIRGLARKHQVMPDALPELSEELHARLSALDAGEADIARLRTSVAEAEAAYDTAAAALSAERRAAAARLDAAVTAELAPLRMERAVFATALTEGDPGPEGRDAVQFTVATNPGAPAGPLARIASGGEMSRFLLALKVCLAAPESGVTMIFDEIDRGVGGATADAVGRRLKALASEGQVLVVTHSPQVAALGAHHWRVEKREAQGRTTTRVVPLDPAGRMEEIARMLAGDRITDQARAAAEALLAG